MRKQIKKLNFIYRQNMGSYQIKHCVPRSENKPKLSSHILPSVNIRLDHTCHYRWWWWLLNLCISRPALVVENIPGLQFIGNQRRPNTKIRVEHILEGAETNADGVCVLDSSNWKNYVFFSISSIQLIEVKWEVRLVICLSLTPQHQSSKNWNNWFTFIMMKNLLKRKKLGTLHILPQLYC